MTEERKNPVHLLSPPFSSSLLSCALSSRSLPPFIPTRLFSFSVLFNHSSFSLFLLFKSFLLSHLFFFSHCLPRFFFTYLLSSFHHFSFSSFDIFFLFHPKIHLHSLLLLLFPSSLLLLFLFFLSPVFSSGDLWEDLQAVVFSHAARGQSRTPAAGTTALIILLYHLYKTHKKLFLLSESRWAKVQFSLVKSKTCQKQNNVYAEMINYNKFYYFSLSDPSVRFCILTTQHKNNRSLFLFCGPTLSSGLRHHLTSFIFHKKISEISNYVFCSACDWETSNGRSFPSLTLKKKKLHENLFQDKMGESVVCVLNRWSCSGRCRSARRRKEVWRRDRRTKEEEEEEEERRVRTAASISVSSTSWLA